MALKDPKGKRVLIHYVGGHVQGPQGLLEYFWDPSSFPTGLQTKVGPKGRHVLVGMQKATSCASGKAVLITAGDNNVYKVHYTGKVRDLYWNLITKAKSGTIKAWRTMRGRKA